METFRASAEHVAQPSRALPGPSRPAAPQLLDSLLSHIAGQIAEYVKYQIDSGADCIMMFDSWGGQLPPKEWDRWSRPYIERIVRQVGRTAGRGAVEAGRSACRTLGLS